MRSGRERWSDEQDVGSCDAGRIGVIHDKCGSCGLRRGYTVSEEIWVEARGKNNCNKAARSCRGQRARAASAVD